MSFSAYPKYKDSGVDWLGSVPAHWQNKRLKFLFDLSRRAVREKDQIVTCFRDGIVTLRVNRRTEGFTNALKEIGYQGVRSGDLVIHAMDAFAGAIGVSDSDGKSSPVYSVCTPASCGISSHYYARLLRHMALSGFVASLAKGIRERSTDFRWKDAAEIFLPVPKADEQVHITRFLDHETARIDELIEEQKCLIELLKEKRQALISRAVTKGLDPNVPMKESGVEWLGEVPKHWGILPAKFLFDFVTSGSRGWAEYYSDSGHLFFRITNLSKNSIQPKLNSIQYVSPPIDSEGSRAKIKSGDILVSITADLGSVCAADEDVEGGYVSQHVALARPNQKVRSSDWLAYFILGDAAREQLLGSGYGGTKVQLSLEDIRELTVTVPPKTEQDTISEELTSRLSEMGALIEEASYAAELLKERRSALISAAVTGKIDVRNWEASADAEAESYALAAEPKAAYETNSS